MRRNRQKPNIGVLFAVLGLGLMLAFVFPPKWLVVVLSFALIICGAALCKS